MSYDTSEWNALSGWSGYTQGAQATGPVAQVQSALNALRVPPPNAPLKVDNILGHQTRAALLWFQSAHGLSQTGRADGATLSALSLASPPSSMGFEWWPAYAVGVATWPALQAARHAWDRFRGKHVPTSTVHGDGTLTDLSHDRSAVARVQKDLNLLGEHLSVDGIAGQQTQGAVYRFQQAHGITPTGRLDIVTSALIELAVGTNPSALAAAAGNAPPPSGGFSGDFYDPNYVDMTSEDDILFGNTGGGDLPASYLGHMRF